MRTLRVARGNASREVDMDEFTAGPPPSQRPMTPARRRASGQQVLERALEEVVERLKVKGLASWRDAEPRHLVALYAKLHEQIYGVLPLELAEDMMGATAAAARLAKELGGPDRVAAFMS